MFELINELRISPISVLNKIQEVYSQCEINPKGMIKSNCNDKKEDEKNTILLIDESVYQTDYDYEETMMSLKDQRFKELKTSITSLLNRSKMQQSALLWSEKCFCYLSEIISNSYEYRSSEAVKEFLSLQFNCRFNFTEVNFIGCEDALNSLTKCLFENYDEIENVLMKNYDFGAIKVMRNIKGEYEYSLFLANKETKESISILNNN